VLAGVTWRYHQGWWKSEGGLGGWSPLSVRQGGSLPSPLKSTQCWMVFLGKRSKYFNRTFSLYRNRPTLLFYMLIVKKTLRYGWNTSTLLNLNIAYNFWGAVPPLAVRDSILAQPLLTSATCCSPSLVTSVGCFCSQMVAVIEVIKFNSNGLALESSMSMLKNDGSDFFWWWWLICWCLYWFVWERSHWSILYEKEILSSTVVLCTTTPNFYSCLTDGDHVRGYSVYNLLNNSKGIAFRSVFLDRHKNMEDIPLSMRGATCYSISS